MMSEVNEITPTAIVGPGVTAVEPEVAAVPAELTFTTTKPVERTAEQVEADTVQFKVDGEVYYAVKPAGNYSYIELAAAASKRARPEDQLHAVLSFFDAVLTPESNHRLALRLRDGNIENRIEHYEELLPVVEKLADQWPMETKTAGPRSARRRGR